MNDQWPRSEQPEKGATPGLGTNDQLMISNANRFPSFLTLSPEAQEEILGVSVH